MMTRLLRDRLFLAWALLAAVTLLSSGLGGGGPGGRWLGPTGVSAAVLAFAFAKAGVVMFEFMELRRAPLVLKVICALWLAVALGALLAILGGVLDQADVSIP